MCFGRAIHIVSATGWGMGKAQLYINILTGGADLSEVDFALPHGSGDMYKKWLVTTTCDDEAASRRRSRNRTYVPARRKEGPLSR